MNKEKLIEVFLNYCWPIHFRYFQSKILNITISSGENLLYDIFNEEFSHKIQELINRGKFIEIASYKKIFCQLYSDKRISDPYLYDTNSRKMYPKYELINIIDFDKLETYLLNQI